MTNLLKKSQKAFQEGGLELFFQKSKNYLYEKTSPFFYHLYFISFKTKILKEIKDFQANNIHDVWNFINNQLHGLIKPMQIKEELLFQQIINDKNQNWAGIRVITKF